MRLCYLWVYMLSHVWLFATPLTIAHQSPLSMGFFRWEYCSGLSFPIPGDLPEPRVEPVSPIFSGRFFTLRHLGSPHQLPIVWEQSKNMGSEMLIVQVSHFMNEENEK